MIQTSTVGWVRHAEDRIGIEEPGDCTRSFTGISWDDVGD